MCKDDQWNGLPHHHSGLAPLEDSSINGCLHLLFHVPLFLKLLRESNHKCNDDECVFCHILRVWEKYRHGIIDADVNSALCNFVPGTQIFESLLTLISYVHHDLSHEENSDISPIVDIFGGELTTESACLKCGTVSSKKEQLMCLQVSLDFHNVQESIEKVLGSKRTTCQDCGELRCYAFKEISRAPSLLLLHLVSSKTSSSSQQFVLNETIHLPKKKTSTSSSTQNNYKVIGAILGSKMAIVRCPDNKLVSCEDRRVKSFSWAKFLGQETGASCKILVYQQVLQLTSQSTPVNSSASCRGTSKWEVTPIDHNNEDGLPQSPLGTLMPRRLDVSEAPHSISKSDSELHQTNNSNSLVSTQSDLRHIPARLTSYKICAKDPKKFKFFTGMSVTNFKVLFEFLGGDDKIKMLKLEYNQKTPQRFRSVRKLSSEDKLFMFFLRLRRGYPIIDLAHVFGIGKEYCSKLLYSMLRYLHIKFEALSRHMFISAEAQNYKKPKPFKPFKNLRVIIDGLELRIECPSNFQQQGNTYSHYKSDNTVRFIVGISCHGGIVFITPGFEGNMTENQALKESGFYDFLQPGDVVMCDRGFEINDELLRRGVEVLKPPSLGGRKKFTPEEEVLTRAIASARIYVEHAVRLIKANRLLRFTVPITMIPTISDYVYVAGFLANFGTKSFQCKYKRKKMTRLYEEECYR